MRKTFNYLAVMLLTGILVGCSIFVHPEPRFPQMKERSIAGPGRLDLPKWSLDGKHIAFVDDDNKSLAVYDFETQQTWTVDTNVFVTEFAWKADGSLTYLKYLPNLEGPSSPGMFDLHQIDGDSHYDTVIFRNLYNASQLTWFADGKQLIAILSAPDSQDMHGDVYLVNLLTNQTTRLISRQELNIDDAIALSLSDDETTLAVRGFRRANVNSDDIILYSLATKSVVKKIVLQQIFPKITLHDRSFQWLRGHRWILVNGSVPNGACYNNALFFLDIESLTNSFCIPTANRSAVSVPSISPDLSHIAFIAPVSLAARYLMLADLTPDYKTRLKQ